MRGGARTDFSLERRREIEAWIAANIDGAPVSVREFLTFHLKYLGGETVPSKEYDAVWRALRRALHITPSSEKRRPSSRPPADGLAPAPKNDRATIEEKLTRLRGLIARYSGLGARHHKRIKLLEERLAKMAQQEKENPGKPEQQKPVPPVPPLEGIDLTKEEEEEAKAASDQIVEHMLEGDGPDPAMKSVNETLMPTGTVLVSHKQVSIPAEIPEDLEDAEVVETLIDKRVRYDFSVAVTRIELDVEKKVVVDADGDRHVISGSTEEYGPPRYSVTWRAMATLAVLVSQFAMPFNRLGILLSTAGKRCTAGTLSRMLHYVAERLVPIYLELATQLANSEILAGDDTSCRVLEVSSHFKMSSVPAGKSSTEGAQAPWAPYRTSSVAEASIRQREAATTARVRRRDEGDRTAKSSPEEEISLGLIIARKLGFESPRKNGDGPKQAMHTTVVSGRSVTEDPMSLIVFYRSHLGSYGNLLEALLKARDRKLRDLVVQGDLSTSNPVTSPSLLEFFKILLIGCGSHARRPFALYEDEDPDRCAYMLHLFMGLAIHEEQLDVIGRNRDNVLAVRGKDSRKLWTDILELAKEMTVKWSKATKLGVAARYIINHIDALTAYLDDPRLEPNNNLRERMLRTEKLIEGSAMFRLSLEGRFVLDVVRTLLQTAVAAGVPVLEYLVSVLRTSEDEIAKNPSRFTPRAWAAANPSAITATTT